MQAEVSRRVEAEEALRRAVDDREFVLHYQPIYALGSSQPSGGAGGAAKRNVIASPAFMIT